MNPTFTSGRAQRGLTLIELMIGMVLGLVVVGAALSVLATNNQTLRATRSLGGLQDGMQTAFEIMARDVREAGGNVCSRRLPVANLLQSNTLWYTGSPGITGYAGSTAAPGVTTGTATGNRISGTDALRTLSMVGSGLTVEEHVPNSAQFKVNVTNHGIEQGDVLMVCDLRQASILQVTNANQSNRTIVHNYGGAGISPGNCSKLLGLPVPTTCGANEGTSYAYGANAQVGRLTAAVWYVGRNDRGGSSLFMATPRNSSGTLSTSTEEVAEGVTNLEAWYLEAGESAYGNAASVGDWSQVTSVRVRFTLQGGQGGEADRVGTNGQTLSRTSTHTITLRNRNA